MSGTEFFFEPFVNDDGTHLDALFSCIVKVLFHSRKRLNAGPFIPALKRGAKKDGAIYGMFSVLEDIGNQSFCFFCPKKLFVVSQNSFCHKSSNKSI